MKWDSYISQKAIPTSYRGPYFAAHVVRDKPYTDNTNSLILRKMWVGGKKIFQFCAAQKTECKALTLVLLETFNNKKCTIIIAFKIKVFHYSCLTE
jgi:hypothetical protein